MLTIKCAYCKTKLYKYLKIGTGKVLRCHKNKITRVYHSPILIGEDVKCPKCKSLFGKDKGKYYDMIQEGFTYTGTKIKK
ncbi:MAG: hypothetical protein Q4Q07_02845 [Tissierellia bacterium]|nr:hypothetical protein [Tissierellia bacterium]